MTLLNIGGYLLFGSVVDGSDVVLMAGAGMPTSVITITGIIMLLAGLIAFVRLLPITGLTKSDSNMDVFLPLLNSLGIYATAMTVYGYLTSYGTTIGAMNLASSVIMSSLMTVMFKKLNIGQGSIVPIRDALRVLGAGLSVVLISLIIF